MKEYKLVEERLSDIIDYWTKDYDQTKIKIDKVELIAIDTTLNCVVFKIFYEVDR